VATIDFPDSLLELERAAWEEIQAGRLTVETAAAVQERLTVFAAEAGIDRYTAETGLKRAVRHAED
jgi:putative heme iron utilization protein